MAQVRTRGLTQRVQFVKPEKDGATGKWRLPSLAPPASAGRNNRGGFAYIIHAAVAEADGTVMLPARDTGGAMGSLHRSGGGARAGMQPVPQVALDSVLPSWARQIHLLKIDTQGYELRVLRGAMESLRAGRYRHVLYELSPWLMRYGNLGEPRELLELLPSMGALCFDMMGLHNLFPHRGYPLEAYFADLDSANHSYIPIEPGNAVGPWDDILCWFPGTERRAPFDMEHWGPLKWYQKPGATPKQRGLDHWPPEWQGERHGPGHLKSSMRRSEPQTHELR